MKRILSFSLTAVMAFSAYSQSLWSDTFETYTVGNLGTQGGWDRDGAVAAVAKVATIDAAHGKSFQFASTASNNAAGAFIYHDTNWSARSSANGIFVAEFDVYTGSTFSEIQFYDVDAGYYTIADLYMSPTNGVFLADQDDFDNETSGTELPLNVTANTWYKVKFTYDVMDTGSMTVTINGTEYGPFEKAPGWFPTEVDFVASGASTSGFDNLTTKAVATLLAVSDVSTKSQVSVYPNPATDVITVKSENKIAQVSIFDISGKAVKTTSETTINVENLAKGSYIVSIKYADGTTESKKVIKK
ncbi:T9SS type A sorting domain-containing protein [Epilithonimonas sp. UC225_85]|uniref:T9SS type A sorting domain-containing protein n=1 Tax=Epilithonimonas sp. UC225_85 TaxID=3350167 RepID=UPI0036D27E70